MKSPSRVQLLATPWTAAYQAPPSMGFSRQEYWSGVPLPSLSWQIEGEKVEAVTDFLFLGSKITVDGDYSHEIKRCLLLGRASLAAQSIKNLSAMQETCVRSLDWEDPLEKEMETHSSILAWRIQRTEEPGRLQSMGFHESDTT